MSPTDPSCSPEELAPHLDAYRGGDGEAADHLSRVLWPPVRRAVADLLGDDHGDCDDVIQEALLAAMAYLRRDEVFEGDFARLAVTIARNRCRDLLRRRTRFPHLDIEPLADWIVDRQASPLDHLEAEEKRHMMQQALDRLGPACRELLHAMYVDEEKTEVIRRRLGLGTVQAVFYRRTACVDQMKNYLQKWSRVRSGADGKAAAGGRTRGERHHER